MKRRGFLAGLIALAVAPQLRPEAMGREAIPAPPVPNEPPITIKYAHSSYGSFSVNFGMDEIRAMLRRGDL